MSDPQVTWGTQRADSARDPNLPRTDDPVKGAQQQDDSTHATAGVQLPGGAKIEITSDGPSNDLGTSPPAAGTAPGSTQLGGQVTIPFGSGATKRVDTSPTPYSPDPAAPDPNECVDDDGRSYPDGWVVFHDNVPVKTCRRGIWMPADPPAPAQSGPGDYQTPAADPTLIVAAADPAASPGWGGSTDPYGGGSSSNDPWGGGTSSTDPWGGDSGSA